MQVSRGAYLQAPKYQSYVGKRHILGYLWRVVEKGGIIACSSDAQLLHISESCLEVIHAVHEQLQTLLSIPGGAKVYLKANCLPRALQDEGPRCMDHVSATYGQPKTIEDCLQPSSDEKRDMHMNSLFNSFPRQSNCRPSKGRCRLSLAHFRGTL